MLQNRADALQDRTGRCCKTARVVLQNRAALLQNRAPVQLFFILLLLSYWLFNSYSYWSYL